MYADVHKFISNTSSAIVCVTMQTFVINEYQQASWIHSRNPTILGTLLLDWCQHCKLHFIKAYE